MVTRTLSSGTITSRTVLPKPEEAALTTPPYVSGEFDPGIKSRPYGNAVAVYESTRWVIGGSPWDENHGGAQMYQTTFALDHNVQGSGTKDKTNWQTTKLTIPGMHPW